MAATPLRWILCCSAFVLCTESRCFPWTFPLQEISQTTKSMYFHLRQIRQVRHYFDKQTCTKAVISLVTSRLDYGNALLCDMSDHFLHRLQVAQTVQLGSYPSPVDVNTTGQFCLNFTGCLLLPEYVSMSRWWFVRCLTLSVLPLTVRNFSIYNTH